MEAVDTVIRADRVMTSEGERAASIGIVNGRIRFIEDIEAALPAREEIRVDADVVVLPGLVDTHVHLQDPGQSAWEGFDSGTRAAAAGGITTVVDMPLDSLPVTVDVPALEVKRKAASGRTHVDLGFWAGVTPSNIPRLGELHRAGVLGFKCFLANTGLPEFPPVSVDEMKAALTELKKFGGFLAVHAEDAAEMAAIEMVPGRSYQDFLAVHPPHIEDLAVSAVIEATRATGGRSHIVHISSARAAGLIQSARADGLEISAETCPHYLTLTSVEVPDGDTSFKVCPPIRDAANADRLWAALSAGSLSMIVSDHSPCAIEHKALDKGDFAEAFGGISSSRSLCPPCGPRRGAAATRSRTSPTGWPGSRPSSSGSNARGRSPRGTTPTCASWHPTRSSPSSRRPCITASPSPPTPDGNCTARSGRPGCGVGPSISPAREGDC